MIQWYINNKPVPRALARYQLSNGLPRFTPYDIGRLMAEAQASTYQALKTCADYGVSVHRIEATS